MYLTCLNTNYILDWGNCNRNYFKTMDKSIIYTSVYIYKIKKNVTTNQILQFIINILKFYNTLLQQVYQIT